MASFLSPPQCTAFLPQSLDEDSHEVFQPFPRLPSELRLKIWKYYLYETPQLYRFNLRYPYRRCVGDAQARYVEAGDHLLLEPVQCIQDNDQTRDPPEEYFLKPLRDMVNTRRIASMTCLESRQVVLELLPDTLSFRILPERWPWRRAPRRGSDRPDGTGFPAYTLRFDGTKDIFIFNAWWEDLNAVLQVAKFKGSLPDDFLKMRHIGIAVNYLRSSLSHVHGMLRYGTWQCRRLDNCTTEACRDHCQYEPLPDFLRLFPLLEKFYIAGVPSSSTHQLGDHFETGTKPLEGANCLCSMGEGMRHSWQVITSSQACGRFVIYDERSECPFPKFERVEELRLGWRAHFPYYEALRHFEIRFIQLFRGECKDCLYKL
jgi:hypothetical protein